MTKRLLYVGAGYDRTIPRFEEFRGMRLVTLDADPAAGCDYIGDMKDLRSCRDWRPESEEVTLGDTNFDAIYSRHSIEHLPTWAVPVALKSWYDHLVPGGLVVIQCPNLLEAFRVWQEQGWNATMYVSPMGPIRPIDTIFGHARMTGEAPLYQHLTGFDANRLRTELVDAGFTGIAVKEVGDQGEDLFAVGYRK